MLNKDWEKTAAAQFQDRRSEVLLDGRERLSGKDMTQRRMEVFEAARGKCAACGRPISWEWFEMHHKKPKSAGRDDRRENLEALCRPCHHGEHS